MKIALIIIGILIFIGIFFPVYRMLANKIATKKRNEQIISKVEPVIKAFTKGKEPDIALINNLADNPETRGVLLSILQENKRYDLFPDKYMNFESAAESSLVVWLLHPNELGTVPDEIQLIDKVEKEAEIEGGGTKSIFYYVFKFRMNPPHWASNDGWMVGVVGPYFDEDLPYTFALGTFSTFEPFDSKIPEEHAEWVHQNIVKKNLLFE